MSDFSVVGVLAEALAQHVPNMRGECDACAEPVHRPGALARHVASVVAALPNIAIVQLPEREKDHCGEQYFDGVSYQVDYRGILMKRVLIDGEWVYAIASPERVEAHAIELLAAARAAGGQG